MIPGKYIDIVELPPAPSGDCLALCGGCGLVIHNRCDACDGVIDTDGPVACEDCAALSARGHPTWINREGRTEANRSMVDIYSSKHRHVHPNCIHALNDWVTYSCTVPA